MVYIPPDFEPARVPEDEAYEGTELDDGVRAALPECTIKWVATHGASFVRNPESHFIHVLAATGTPGTFKDIWAINSRIDTILPDGTEQSYFLKVYTAEKAKEMAQGEYEGSKALYAALPDNIPKPVAAGALAKNPKKHFYLAEFRDMDDNMPGTTDFASVVAKLHESTESPNGMFGFHIRTFGGDFPVNTSWTATWEEFFTRLMRDTMEKERAIQGPNDELDRLCPLILNHVIPRLLRPMESDGRKIKPVLIHGDLWHGNVAVDVDTKEPVLYDPCAFYGHNEFEFAPWRAARYRTSRRHVQEYFKILDEKMTEPTENQDDRHALYAMRNNLMVSSSWVANKQTRQLAIEEMKRLVEKYCATEATNM